MNLEEQLEQLQTLNHLIEEAKHKIAFRNKIWSQFDSLSDERKEKCKRDNEITERAIKRLELRIRKLLFKAYLDYASIDEIYNDCASKVREIEHFYYQQQEQGL